MAGKHIIAIHGRATKPDEETKNRLVIRALQTGIARVDPKLAQAFPGRDIKFTLVYYGDINNKIMVEASPKHKENMVQRNGIWYERSDAYDEPLETLVARETKHHEEEHYNKLLDDFKDLRFVDDLARFGSGALSLFGLSALTERATKWAFPDLAAYLTTRMVGSAVRDRLQRPLKQALMDGDEICLISHSMGCIVAYDVLWKFSRMSEYIEVREKPVSLWLTLGNPLGEPSVQNELYDADEREDGKFPTNVHRWSNITAHDDIIAHDATIEDDFREMTRRGFIEEGNIRELPRIYNFWVRNKRSNPHKFYGYLNHPEFAQALVDWIKR